LGALGVAYSSVVLIALVLLLFHFLFSPVHIEVDFLSVNNKSIKKHHVKKLLDPNDDNKSIYKIQLSISKGNRLTNALFSLVGCDLVVLYRPSAYDTEVSDGWGNSRIRSSNLYKDKKGNARYLWTDSVVGAGKIKEDDAIKLCPEIIIVPKRFEVISCQVDLKIKVSKKKNVIQQFFAFFIKSLLVKVTKKDFKIIYK
uniref:hypothetical protein n=1 Tax=Lysinibacillus sp. GbtcB16 TaxID=2824761 RepID=UPI001C2FC04D